METGLARALVGQTRVMTRIDGEADGGCDFGGEIGNDWILTGGGGGKEARGVERVLAGGDVLQSGVPHSTRKATVGGEAPDSPG